MNTASETGFVSSNISNGIGTITFYHPSSNTLPSNLLQDLTLQIDDLGNNSDVFVIILRSEGNTFCAGASFDELLSINNFENGKIFFSGFANVINAMRTCKKIIIARVQGKAVGGGVGLISACDYVFATQNASVKLSEIAIGIGPFVIEPAVSRKIGKMAMSQLSLAAHEWKSAQWAFDHQLFYEIFDTIHDMDANLSLFASKLASYNPDALIEMKKIFWENTSHWETLLYERAAISGELVLSNFTKNALLAFKNK